MASKKAVAECIQRLTKATFHIPVAPVDHDFITFFQQANSPIAFKTGDQQALTLEFDYGQGQRLELKNLHLQIQY